MFPCCTVIAKQLFSLLLPPRYKFMHSQQHIIKRPVLLLVLLFLAGQTMAQRVFVNYPTGFYEITGGAGNCTNVTLTNECAPTLGNSTFSMAVFKDTIYYLNGPTLHSFKIGVPGSCRTYASVGTFSSMTVDQNGILYFASNQLYRYNPYTNQLTNLGTMPFSSAGDLIFFNGKLLMAGNPPGIYDINMNNPALSTLYMGTNGLQFYGLISFPVPCGNSRYFGLAPQSGGTTMYELDLVNKVVIGTSCTLGGVNVYDAGSTTEGGLNAGITVTNLQVTQPCLPATTGSVNIRGVLDNLPVTYTLDNTVTNTTGVFNDLIIGDHTIRLEAGSCTLDTTFNIAIGLNPAVDIQKTNVTNCDANNGVITLTAASGHLPISYTLLNNNLTQTNGTFIDLLPDTYLFRIKDAVGCTKDTSVQLILIPPAFTQGVQLDGAHCGSNTGFVKMNIVGGDTTGVTTSLAGAAFEPKVSYYNLAPGSYRLQAKRGAICSYDTTIVIDNIVDPKPALAVQLRHQLCYGNNGNIAITATATGYTFTYQLNGAGFSSVNSFGNLAPGQYTVGIRNQYDCKWDTIVNILPYPKLTVQKTTVANDPECENPYNGDIRVQVAGVEGPYNLLLNNKSYANGELITGLTEGDYTIYINNKDGCTVDSVLQTLTIVIEPHCVTVYVPSAFTPNGDGRNDIFRPLQSYFTRNMRLQIYNRYGQLLYQGTGPGVQWDGTFKGAAQANGSYVYWLTYTDFTGVEKQLKGSVLLIR